jgi:hypothetical protein
MRNYALKMRERQPRRTFSKNLFDLRFQLPQARFYLTGYARDETISRRILSAFQTIIWQKSQ